MMLLDWSILKHFKKYGTSDVWGDPNKLDATLLMKADDLREFVGMTIHVVSGYRDGDPREHGQGNALDLICPGLPLLDFYLAAERFGFTGLGVYPHWQWDGVVTGGLHCDVRPLGVRIGTHNTEYKGARWLAYKNDEGNQIYTVLNKENLKRYNVI